MKLRSKLLLAQLPLVLALLMIVVAGGLVAGALGRSSQSILRANYRSVLAIERMKDAIERMNRANLGGAPGRSERAPSKGGRSEPDSSAPVAGTITISGEALAGDARRFEEELRVQEGNITETGEKEATARLRLHWEEFRRLAEQLARGGRGGHEPSNRDEASSDARPGAAGSEAGVDGTRGSESQAFVEAVHAYEKVREAADTILGMNQDAMVRKSKEAERLASRSYAVLVVVSLVGLVLGLFTSVSLTSRILRPVSVLGQAVQRLGQGDPAARAQVDGRDEIATLAREFNAMAERIQKYRDSSIGELLEAQRAAQATIDSLPDPVLVAAVDGSLLHVNRAAEELLGVGVEGGASALAALPPSLRAVVERILQHVSSGKGPFVPKGFDEAILVGTREGDRHILPRASPVYTDEGAVVGTTILLQDVTRLQRFEALRNDLVATVAHELRTPLTSLRMAIHLLREQVVGPLTEKQADLVQAATEECERLQSTADELLDLSRIQSGRMDLRRRDEEVDDLVRSAIEAHQGQASQGQVSLRSEVLPGTGRVAVDAERIQIVFANLLGNAIRHSPRGGAVVVRAVADGGWVRFEVADQGPGIPKEFHDAIFQKYFQVPDQDRGGVGLGLPLAKEIVLAHGGTIGIESAPPGRGSVFWFRLPSAREENKRAATADSDREARGSGRRKRTDRA